ncbi:DUF1761 domain-containing protein [Candidatus Parcubacteria bacterium]|nr:DUF1761 domain-containing protein [Candidatus Parcubacteria bacterium]
MEINYLSVLACGVFAMVAGFLWYGPLFGKVWLGVIGASADDLARRAEMQKRAMPLYLVQFLLVLFQAYVLAHFVKGWTEATGVETALWIWVGFIMPTVAAGSMWNNDSARISWTRFALQAGYQLICLVAFGFILGYWQ